MPPPERSGGEGRPGAREARFQLSCIARFRTEELAVRAYFEAQEAIFETEECDLSAFRLQLDGISHAVILGATPRRPLARRLQRILSAGDPATLPDEILAVLKERRIEASGRASWIERHFRPGRRL